MSLGSLLYMYAFLWLLNERRDAVLHRSSTNNRTIAIGVIFPRTTAYFADRLFTRRFKAEQPQQQYNFANHFTFRKIIANLSEVAFPMDTIRVLCDQMVKEQVVAIIYLAHWETYGRSSASIQYLIHMASYTGIPIIAWNADNSAHLTDTPNFTHTINTSLKNCWNAINYLRKTFNLGKYRLLQLAPSLRHQVEAMIQILIRYDWKKFAVITSMIAGKNFFVQLCMSIAAKQNHIMQLDMVTSLHLNTDNQTSVEEDLIGLSKSEARIFLFYATSLEAKLIFALANKVGLTGSKFMWIATQSVVGTEKTVLLHDPALEPYPPGMMAIHFNTEGEIDKEDKNIIILHMTNAMYVLNAGLDSYLRDKNYPMTFASTSNCNSDVNFTWSLGDEFYKHLKKVKLKGKTGVSDHPDITIEFDENGFMKETYLTILNLKPDKKWENIGEYTGGVLKINDISWPGGMRSPPQGVPEKHSMRIVTLDEPPFIIVSNMDPSTNKCPNKQAVECEWGLSDDSKNQTVKKCCSGYCVDLLNLLADEIGFDYVLYKVPDDLWGVKKNGHWNGLVAELVEKRADLCVTALKINSERELDIDFSVPFLETGITITVAYRGGALSPTAFLEPFEYTTWFFILVVSIQLAAVSIFFFEWLSPRSFDRKTTPPPGHKFSLFRSFWLVWATLFSASVNTDIPRSHTARFMALVWAAFSLTFLAVYTANLAAFMITRTEFYDLTGIDDPRITNPHDMNPPFRYGTVSSGNTEATLRRNYRQLYRYIQDNNFVKQNVTEGIKSVKKGEFHAFIYDSVVLEYLAGRDDNCAIGTVGKWFSMTGYGIGFPKNSKWLKMVNQRMLKYQESGQLERLQNFWLTGACSPKTRDKKNHSSPLGVENFVSAFVLLTAGVTLCLILISCEFFYTIYLRTKLRRCNKGGWCGLISLSMGRSLSFKEAVEKIHTKYKMEKTKSINFRTYRERLLETQLKHALTEIGRLKSEEKNESKVKDVSPVRAVASVRPSVMKHIKLSDIETEI